MSQMKNCLLEVPVPFWVWMECALCGNSFFCFFDHGRPETSAEDYALPCSICGRRAVMYTSALSTVN